MTAFTAAPDATFWGGDGRDLLITRDKIRGNDRIQGGSGTDRCRTDFVRVCP
jgi:Ca2+-binding RTX toxin-like protein